MPKPPSVMPQARSLNRAEVKITVTEFSRRLRDFKAQMKYSNKELARRLNVTPKTVRDWLAEVSEPRLASRKQVSARMEELTAEAQAPKDVPEKLGKTEAPSNEPKPKMRPLRAEDRNWS